MINLVESIQKNLGYSALCKVDPNTQEVDTKEKNFGAASLSQAAIPSVLYGLLNYILRPGTENAISILSHHNKWLTTIFSNKTDDVVERVATYAGVSTTSAAGEMEHIAAEAVRLVKENIADKESQTELRSFSIDHKGDALLYLPAALQIGKLLGDDNIDDRTHKMEGPISSLMHSFEKHFNNDTKD